MRENFERSLELVLMHEGGYVNHPDDPGGETNRGVTKRTYDAWRRSQGLAPRSVRQITDDEVREIYRRQYWDAVRADELPGGVDYAVFDYAVNSGPRRAATDLQRVVGARPDGIVGEQTKEATWDASPAATVSDLCDRRLRFMRSLRHWSTFARGWTARVTGVEREGLAMASAAPPAAIAPIPTPKARPEDIAISSQPEAVGGGLTGIGAAGATVTEIAQQVAPMAPHAAAVQYVFLALMLLGVGLTVWALIRRTREREV